MACCCICNWTHPPSCMRAGKLTHTHTHRHAYPSHPHNTLSYEISSISNWVPTSFRRQCERQCVGVLQLNNLNESSLSLTLSLPSCYLLVVHHSAYTRINGRTSIPIPKTTTTTTLCDEAVPHLGSQIRQI